MRRLPRRLVIVRRSSTRIRLPEEPLLLPASTSRHPSETTQPKTRFDWYGFSSHVTQAMLRAANAQSERRLRLIAGILAATGVVLYLLRDKIKDQMSEEAAELTSRTMQQESVRTSAEIVGKYLAHEILHDPTVASAAAKLASEVIKRPETKDAALDLVAWIVDHQRAREVVRELLKDVVIDLAKDDHIIAGLGTLLAAALDRSDTRKAVVDVAENLLGDPRANDAVRDLAIRLVKRDDARAALAATLADATHRVLDDPSIRTHTVDAASEALSDAKVQQSAGDALWNAYKYSIGLKSRRPESSPDDVPRRQPSSSSSDEARQPSSEKPPSDAADEQRLWAGTKEDPVSDDDRRQATDAPRQEQPTGDATIPPSSGTTPVAAAARITDPDDDDDDDDVYGYDVDDD